ncbi:replication protein, putative (plasmid) [Ketogulonicigenium vulgare Y25]|uniref:Replication protein, putative n=1 Tax=Ketogulonicigenium vulgare (strain WSH-001) TaxID=759362 RepID=F9YBC8_KETVW|nr:ParB N-terminal domain-containing protein [Ketogulonicigenium vulgare]ADO44243.1 replication protein, putative [Ketogulonicigenium vulgare Y25]AEM42680.1 Replication protein, putative [Ketogulonicigenium vulgare WSH-001]ALJ82680.1 replication protein [Ketogulonicigenium vulgare]
MKKRRIFDITLPDEDDEIFPAGKIEPEKTEQRRSPMATAISENAGALRERSAIEAEIRAENDALAAEHVRMKQLGLMVDLIPLDQIETYKLVRDRRLGDDLELAELTASIQAIGLSNAIRVEQREDGKYELIQGLRRLSAYRALLKESGDAEKWGRIPAGILPRGEDLEHLYRRMVDENLVRKDISFAEMARLALDYAADPGTKQSDPDRVVAELFQSAGYQKRSYIRQFIRIMDVLGLDLQFAPHIPRALGLKLSTLLDERPEVAHQIRTVLRAMPNRSVADELNLLRQITDGQPAPSDEASDAPVRATTGGVAAPVSRRAKTTFQVPSHMGQARCTAANGRLEIKLDCDFSALDRRKLELALTKLLSDLE